MSGDIDALIAGLTEAQRSILLRPLGITSHAFYVGLQHRAARALVATFILQETSDSIGNPMFRFTHFGLQVRARLQEPKA